MAGMYPTGVSPVAFDMDNTMRAVTQQMVKFRQNELQEKKEQVDQNELAILKALDFDTIQGLSDQVALEHTNNIKNLTDKWAQRYKERGGILSSQDKLELVKDKRGVEQKMASAASDVAQIKEITSWLSDKRTDSWLDKKATLDNLMAYQKSGKVGSGGAINIPVRIPPVFGEQFMANADPIMKQRASIYEELPELVGEQGKVVTAKSNKKSVDQAIEWLASTPEYLQLEQQDPAKSNAMLEQLRTKYLNEGTSAKYIASLAKKQERPAAGDATLKAQKEAETAYNDWAERVWQGDVSALEAFKGKDYTEIKTYPDKIEIIGKDKEGADVVVGTISKGMNKADFKKRLWDFAPSSVKGGLKTPPNIKADYAVSAPIQKAEMTDMSNFKSSINKELKSYQDYSDIASSIQKILPNAEVEAEGRGYLGFGSRAIIFNGKRYQLNQPGKKEKLIEAVEQEYDSQNDVVPFMVDGQTVEIPKPKVDEFLKENPTATKVYGQ